MGELPIAPLGRIIKNAGAQRVGNDAKEALAKHLEEHGEKVASYAVKLAEHAGRKTVTKRDIKYGGTWILMPLRRRRRP